TRYDDDLAESEKEWQAIIKAAHTYNPYGLSGTGIVAMGGVAFDILQDKSDLWSNFPNSKLSIPECLVTRVAGRLFLTVNQFIDASIVLRDVMDDIHRLESDILDLPMAQISSHQIIQQTEIEPEAWKELVREAVAQIEANKA